MSISCADKPECGWSASGFYDCNTSGNFDPGGVFPMSCLGRLGDGGVPPSDSGKDAGDDPCEGIGREGCCDGEKLMFCDGGQIKALSCELNPSCGWFPMGGYYDCGMTGAEDPSGTFPRACPGTSAADARPDTKEEDLDGGGERLVAGDGEGPEGNGCSCDMGGPTSSDSWVFIILFIGICWRTRLREDALGR